MEIVDVQTQGSVVCQHSPGALVAAVVCPASGRSALADSSTVSQLRTLQRRIKVWRAERVRELILGGLRKSADTPIEA